MNNINIYCDNCKTQKEFFLDKIVGNDKCGTDIVCRDCKLIIATFHHDHALMIHVVDYDSADLLRLIDGMGGDLEEGHDSDALASYQRFKGQVVDV